MWEGGTRMHIPQKRTSQGQQPQGAQAMGSPDAGAGWMEGRGRRAKSYRLGPSSPENLVVSDSPFPPALAFRGCPQRVMGAWVEGDTILLPPEWIELQIGGRLASNSINRLPGCLGLINSRGR